MHIAAGHMNPHATQSSVSASVLAARRADETRRKLAAASAELDAIPTAESAWIIDAWSGGNSGSHHSGQHPNQELDEGTSQASLSPSSLSSPSLSSSDQIVSLSAAQAGFQSSAQVANQIAAQSSRPLLVSDQLPASGEEIRRTPATGPVSFWA